MVIENYRSNLVIKVRFVVGENIVSIPLHDFTLRFRTVGHYGTYFDCKYEKGVFINCHVEGQTLVCDLDNHGLYPGELTCEFYDHIPSPDFTDGNRTIVTPCGMDLTLVTTAAPGVDAEIAIQLEMVSWLQDEVYGPSRMLTVKENSYLNDHTITLVGRLEDRTGTTSEGKFMVWFFPVKEGEHWKIRREAGVATGGYLCALYACDTTSEIGSETCVSGSVSASDSLNVGTAVEHEYTSIPEGAKWLGVTVYIPEILKFSVQREGYAKPSEQISEMEQRVANLVNSFVYDYSYENFEPIERNDDYKLEYRYIATGGYVNDENSGNHYYDLYGYSVNPGEQLRIYCRGNSGSPANYKVFAFYSAEEFSEIGRDNYVPTDEDSAAVKTVSDWTTTLIVPNGAKWLAVLDVTSWQNFSSVQKNNPITLKSVIEGTDSDTIQPTPPYTMKASRNGTTIKVLSKPSGSEQEYIFVLDETMNNMLMSLKQVYGRAVTEGWDMGTTGAVSLMNNGSAGSSPADSIGPIAINGTNYSYGDFIGGNHPISGTSVKTARTLNWSVVAHRRNGEHSLNDGKEMMCDAVTLKAVHLISRPTLPATAQSVLIPTLLETVTITVRENRAEVEVRHDYPFELPEGAVVWDYYGMQSVFGSTSSMLIKTPDGPLTSWTSEDELVTVPDDNNQKKDYTISKVDYPLLSQFIQKNSAGWCQSAHIDRWYGIGDRSIDGAGNTYNVDLSMRLAWQSGKVYHRLIGGHPLSRGESYSWRGTYSWWKEED